LRRYTKAAQHRMGLHRANSAIYRANSGGMTDRPRGRGLHSSTFWLNISTFCEIRWVHISPPVY